MIRDNQDTDKFILSTGKKIFANAGIIGLEKLEGNEWAITDGYDGNIDYPTWNEEEEPRNLTKEERIEVTDYMITLWECFKKDLLKNS